MKTLFVIFLSIFAINSNAQYENYFTNEALRVDFTLSGDIKHTNIAQFEVIKEVQWGGSKTHLEPPFSRGQFQFVVKDSASQQTILKQGFSTLFEEWQTTTNENVSPMAFMQSIQCPFPKNNIIIDIERRNDKNEFERIHTFFINPNSYEILHKSAHAATHKMIDNGASDKCVDIVFVAEGYTKDEMAKFHNDAINMTNYLFTQAPFNELKNKFNIWLVDAISEESGVTDPRKNIWKNTALKSSFNTLNSDRYLETTHTFLVRDYAGLVPYDQIYILANTEKYGGGGIYNHFSLTSVDNVKSKTVFIHEFGHAFAGLGDEYYYDKESYAGFYTNDSEPWEPNLTTLHNFESKWKKMMNKNTPIPTPSSNENPNTIGVYEGGGYSSKGVYRPYINCRMKTNEAPAFCPVCEQAIKDVILYLCE